MYFNLCNGGFYEDAPNHPHVKLSKPEYNKLISGQDGTQEIKAVENLDGSFSVLLAPVNSSPEQFYMVELSWVQSELARARDELDKVQDGDTKADGSVLDWRSYRKNLRAWGEHKDFPQKEFRPKAPDAE